MTDFVIDTSAAVELFGGRDPDPDLRRTVLTGRGVAPELFDIEALSTLRRIVRTGALSIDEGSAVLQRVRVAPITRATHRPLLSRIWDCATPSPPTTPPTWRSPSSSRCRS